jgi:hypothetical protein
LYIPLIVSFVKKYVIIPAYIPCIVLIPPVIRPAKPEAEPFIVLAAFMLSKGRNCERLSVVGNALL